MVRIDFDNKEIIYKRKRYPLRPFKLYMLHNYEKVCCNHRVKGWVFDWETIMYHARKYYIINEYLKSIIYETKKEIKKNKNID